MRDADILERLGELGLELPRLPEPVASYIPVTQAGALRVRGGTGRDRRRTPAASGQARATGVGRDGAGGGRAGGAPGVVGDPRSPRGEPRSAWCGSCRSPCTWRRMRSSSSIPTVANGASDMLVAVLGPDGRHARAAVGVASLPLGASVEVAVTAEVSGVAGSLRRAREPQVAVPPRDAPLVEPSKQGHRVLPAGPEGLAERAHRDPGVARVAATIASRAVRSAPGGTPGRGRRGRPVRLWSPRRPRRARSPAPRAP